MISVSRLKVRILALMLYFLDCKVLIFCFTFIIEVILLTFLLESAAFLETELPLKQLGIFVVTQLLLGLVSYGTLGGVGNIRTLSKTLLLCITFSLVATLFNTLHIRQKIQKVQSFTSKELALKATVLSIEGGNRSIGRVEENSFGDVLLKESSKSVLHSGDICTFKGKLVKPESFDDFDYRKYLYRKGIYSILEVNSSSCSKKKSFLLSLRSELEETVESLIPEPESSLLIGIILGTKREFTDQFDNIVRNSGVSHIIAASGYNISILILAVEKIFKFLKTRSRVVVQLSFVWIYTVVAGMSASLLRASTMSSIYLVSVLTSRTSSRHISVLLCVAVLLSFKPFLAFDIGFLLSLFSTLSLIYFLPSIDSEKIPTVFRNYLLPTLSCTLFTLPITVSTFESVSTVSILANFLVLPIIESTMIFGILSVFSYLIFPSLKFLFVIPYLQLVVFKYIITLLSPFGSVVVIIKPIVILVIYLLLFLFCIFKYPIGNEKRNYYIKKATKYIGK